jgi:hypothetical protein
MTYNRHYEGSRTATAAHASGIASVNRNASRNGTQVTVSANSTAGNPTTSTPMNAINSGASTLQVPNTTSDTSGSVSVYITTPTVTSPMNAFTTGWNVGHTVANTNIGYTTSITMVISATSCERIFVAMPPWTRSAARWSPCELDVDHGPSLPLVSPLRAAACHFFRVRSASWATVRSLTPPVAPLADRSDAPPPVDAPPALDPSDGPVSEVRLDADDPLDDELPDDELPDGELDDDPLDVSLLDVDPLADAPSEDSLDEDSLDDDPVVELLTDAAPVARVFREDSERLPEAPDPLSVAEDPLVVPLEAPPALALPASDRSRLPDPEDPSSSSNMSMYSLCPRSSYSSRSSSSVSTSFARTTSWNRSSASGSSLRSGWVSLTFRR